MSKTCSIDHVIGSRLKQKRIESGIESECLCFMLGIKKEQLLDFECGKQRIDARILYKICKTLELPIQYFFEPWIGKKPRATKIQGGIFA